MRNRSSLGVFYFLLAAFGTLSCATKGAADVDASVPDAGPPPKTYVYVSGSTLKIYTLDSVTGELTATGGMAGEAAGATWMTPDSSHKFLYVLTQKKILAFSINAADGSLKKINEQPIDATTTSPDYISIDASDKWLFVSYYSTGHVTVHAIGSDGGVGARVDIKQPVTYTAHSVVPDIMGKFVFVQCVQANFIAQFKLDTGTGLLTANDPATAPSGLTKFTTTDPGPRHLAFHPSQNFAYSINEDSFTMSAYKYDPSKGTLSSIQVLPTVKDGESASSAHVVVHPSGKFVFGSNRATVSTIVVFSADQTTGMLTFVETNDGDAKLKRPESFALDPAGKYLLAPNMGSNDLTVFEIDQTTGKLTVKGQPKVPNAPESIVVLSLP